MTTAVKKLASHTSIYFIGNLLRRLVSFVMLPIYTRHLTTADYGTVELLSTVLDFVGIVVGLRIGSALFRFYSEYESEKDKNEVITTGLILVGLLNILGVILIYLFSKPVSLMLFESSDGARLLTIYSLTLLGAALIEIPMSYLRALQRPWLFVFFSVTHLTVQLSLNIYFVVFQNMHVEGVVYSAVFSTAVTSTLILSFMLRKTGFSFSMKKAKELTSFSWPLIITSLIAFYIVFGDRYFLKFYNGLSEVGLYSLSYKFAFLIGLFVGPFFKIWQTEQYIMVKKDNATKKIKDVMLLFSILLVFSVTVISVFVEDVLKIMADSAFWPAYKVVPFLLMAQALNSLGDFTKLGILLEKRTTFLIYSNLLAAAVITVGYVFLIPPFGATGAALATLSAYIVRFLYTTYISQKFYRLEIPWLQMFFVFCIGLVVFLLSKTGPGDLVASIIFDSFLIAVFLISMFILPILPTEIRTSLFLRFRKLRSIF